MRDRQQRYEKETESESVGDRERERGRFSEIDERIDDFINRLGYRNKWKEIY